MSWEFIPNFDAAFRAAITAGRNLIYVCPPSWWMVRPLIEAMPSESASGTSALVLIPDAVGLRETATFFSSFNHLRPAHAATGLTRTGRLLNSANIRTLVSTPADLLRLLTRSAIDPQALERIVLCWPELHESHPELTAIETILAECRNIQRVVLTSDPSCNTVFLERHAHRAPTAIAEPPVETAVGAARYVVTDFFRTPEVVNAALDVLNPVKATIWDPTPEESRLNSLLFDHQGATLSAKPDQEMCDLAIATVLPTREAIERLQANARNVLLLIRPYQIPFVNAMVASTRPMRLPSESDRAHDRAYRLRQEIRDHIDKHPLLDGYLALGSLYDEFDPATVAAALASRLSIDDAREEPGMEVPTWTRIRVDAGKRHHIRTGDLVGALLNAVQIPKNRVGKVDVREGYSLIEVHAEVADKAVKGLNGILVRGNKLTARPDRH